VYSLLLGGLYVPDAERRVPADAQQRPFVGERHAEDVRLVALAAPQLLFLLDVPQHDLAAPPADGQDAAARREGDAEGGVLLVLTTGERDGLALRLLRPEQHVAAVVAGGQPFAVGRERQAVHRAGLLPLLERLVRAAQRRLLFRAGVMEPDLARLAG